ncbi:MAG TPA: hypothetical protein VH000_12565, partial [Rhizomicrobium sp.]|nr:hypothetical protein [Rhizomicrobium sp.]
MALLQPRGSTEDHPFIRVVAVAVAATFIALFLVLPLVAVFGQALAGGLNAALDAINEHDALEAIKLTLIVAAIAVPMNAVFGIAAAWAITKFDFPGKSILT